MRRGGGAVAAALALVLALAASPASAQAQDTSGAVLVLRQDVLFEQSAFGRASLERIERESRALAGENRQIEAALEAEERGLTDERPTLAPEVFRAKAEAFNEKVEGIRRAQEAKSRAITRLRDEDRQTFLAAAAPVLAEMMQERGASVILDRQSVVISLDRADVTADAIARIDARIGAGDVSQAPPSPAPSDPGATPPPASP